MTDDLVKRLRMVTGFIRFKAGDRIAASACLSEEAADRIEVLEARVKQALEVKQPTAEMLLAALEAYTSGQQSNPPATGQAASELKGGKDE